MTSLPKVLIFGQPFNSRHGGGITLSNLFRGWDREKIAVAATGHVMNNVTTDVCDKYYQLGAGEFKWQFPFNLMQRKFQSGVLSFEDGFQSSPARKKSEFRYTLVNKFFYPTLEWLGIFHGSARINFSDNLKKWLTDFGPELVYLQVSTRDTMLFAMELLDYLKVPSVIHIMDDWPSTISNKGILRKYWHNRIDREFKDLLDRTNLFLSISDAMSAEYKKRYDKDFIAFHNPIDIQFWTQKSKTSNKLTADYVKILFSGRIGIGVGESLIDLGKVVESLNNEGAKIKLHIQSPSNDYKILDKLRNLRSVIINPIAEYKELPAIFSNADILAITNDFDKKSIDYLRYSMPTKASEYMISGTPILVYSDSETAVSRFFKDNNCGCCVTERHPGKLKDAIKIIIEDEKYRQEISTKAFMIASELFDAETVRANFRKLLISSCLKNK